MSTDRDVIFTGIWEEIPEPDNPFAAAACYCAGFDVYGDLLGKASWIEYLYLLFRLEPPAVQQTAMLERLAVALANPGPRDPGVRAAMNAAVGGAPHAAWLSAALAVGAGQLGGAREVGLAMDIWHECGTDLPAWERRLSCAPQAERADIWPEAEHPPGFDPHGAACATPVQQTLAFLGQFTDGDRLRWLGDHRDALERAAGCPLAMTGVAAAALCDLGFNPSQGELLYLLFRLPGAAVHALEQQACGYRRYPFFHDALELSDDPGPAITQGKRAEPGG